MEWSFLLVSVIASIAIIVQSAHSQDKLDGDEIKSGLPIDSTDDLTDADISSLEDMIALGKLSDDDVAELLKRGTLLRFGKRGSLFRFGKRGSLFRFGKRGSLLRFGKRGEKDEGYWSDGRSLFRYGKRELTPFFDETADKRGSLFRFGKRPALFRYGRSADKGPHTPFRFGREELGV